ncbi:enoyl-CoA hydratase-related protein [Microbacterium rhizomatis]|uniref:enoyl-CoA hydratase n=1 Tax=Microbacterium rhizomatis TaxID=1631477 RepID=A0A5J5J0Z0_9MICO|nr:enoyl-CoA hydratase-related protein [Microbacterium rhizomatis]KAA9108191.1 enoyl-CoA hydratase [Microbacterium rhizomatis]
MTTYQAIVTKVRGRVAWITLNRPEVLNALNHVVRDEVVAAAQAFDADTGIGAIVLTGSERAFAAGADIGEISDITGTEVLVSRVFDGWEAFAALRTPVIAAVSGYALGGGCELAMMCDVIIAADTAQFGQPEITLGIIPGMGGAQRLVRTIGYYKAADLVLTGRMMDAAAAERAGLVSRVVPAAELLSAASEIAAEIAARSLPAVYAAKAALDTALETSLAEGLRFERHAFAALFDTADRKEGMAAFRAKRAPEFQNR